MITTLEFGYSELEPPTNPYGWPYTAPHAVEQELTGNAYLDGVMSGWKWSSSSLRFNFPSAASYYAADYSNQHEPENNFHQATSAQQAAVRWALSNQFAAVANLSFTEVGPNSTAEISVARSDAPDRAWGKYPDDDQGGGDVWFNFSQHLYDTPVRGGHAWRGVMHELGHALGLKHPQETDIANHQTTHNTVVPVERDSIEFTLMSYHSYVGGPEKMTYEEWGASQTLMMYDIAALQEMYGADFTTNSGNTTYSFSPLTGEMFVNGVAQGLPGADRVFLTIWDGGGADTYDFSNYTSDLQVDLAPGAWSVLSPGQLADLDAEHPGTHMARGNVFNALLHDADQRSLIENARGGSGADTIFGNQASNTLRGNDGADELFGRSGDDNLYGGNGNDTLDGGWGADNLYGGANSDELHGGWHNDALFGEAGDDHLFGEDGNDTLSGGTGNDALWGGSGDDTFLFSTGSGLDAVHDFVAGGTQDRIVFSDSPFHSLADVLAASMSVSGGTLIQTGPGSSILLESIDPADLTAADFYFGWLL